jgi:hypothetical protein
MCTVGHGGQLTAGGSVGWHWHTGQVGAWTVGHASTCDWHWTTGQVGARIVGHASTCDWHWTTGQVGARIVGQASTCDWHWTTGQVGCWTVGQGTHEIDSVCKQFAGTVCGGARAAKAAGAPTPTPHCTLAPKPHCTLGHGTALSRVMPTQQAGEGQVAWWTVGQG